MAILSLDELKAENAATENEEEPTPQVVESENEDAPVEVEAVEDGEAAEPDPDKPETTDTDDWKEPDGHTSEKLFTSRDIRAARIKAGEKADRRNSGEVEELRKELSELKGRSAKPDTLSRPKREQFFEAEDPDVAFEDATFNWMRETFQADATASNASAELTRRNTVSNEERNRATDEHYERAVKLAQDSNISAELYQKSDLKVREMIESLYPGGGDLITDELIRQIGEGSEKVMFSIGIKQTRLDELRNKLQSDQSGIKAALYLGSLKADLTNPRKRKTTAPAPTDVIDGDAPKQINGKQSKKDYDAAHKVGDITKAFALKRTAKKAGVDTKSW